MGVPSGRSPRGRGGCRQRRVRVASERPKLAKFWETHFLARREAHVHTVADSPHGRGAPFRSAHSPHAPFRRDFTSHTAHYPPDTARRIWLPGSAQHSGDARGGPGSSDSAGGIGRKIGGMGREIPSKGCVGWVFQAECRPGPAEPMYGGPQHEKV